MKVAVINNQEIFVEGGAEYLADSLRDQLVLRGHEATVIRIPFKWYPPSRILDHILACRLMKIDPTDVDLVIALKFPAYSIPFANKKVWLLHQFRQAYDLWGTPFQDIPNTPEGRRVRDMVRVADEAYLPEALKIYTNSQIVARRLQEYSGVEANGVLYPPLSEPNPFRSGEFGDYFFYPSRIVPGKRQRLAIEAMRFARPGLKLVLAGTPVNATHELELRSVVENFNLQERVRFLGWVSEEEKARWMADARGILYLPYDEDSYGFVTLEAFTCHKPVITLADSGGTKELVTHEVTGLVAQPSPEAVAQAMNRLWAERTWAIELGENAYRSLSRLEISWDKVVRSLLA